MGSSPNPDILILLRASSPGSSKQKLKAQTEKAQKQYSNLIQRLKNGGLKAVARRGEELGHLIVFVKAPDSLLSKLIIAERHADVLTHIPLTARPTRPQELSPADRLRLVFTYVTAVPEDGGLGIAKELPEWNLIESISALHDEEFNDMWIREWTTHTVSSTQIFRLKDQFGAPISTYFSFLQLYTRFLSVPTALGLVFFFLQRRSDSGYWSYHPLYSILVAIWSTVWVQWWRAHEKALAISTGYDTSSSHDSSESNSELPVKPLNTSHPRRATYSDGHKWYHRESRVFFMGGPTVLAFVAALGCILTSLFLLEAFVAQLYRGPGANIFPLLPTVLFSLTIPTFVKFSTKYLESMTERENHRSRNGWESSMTMKVWALNATVAYLGLFLSAFVYIPMGDGVLSLVSRGMGVAADAQPSEKISEASANMTATAQEQLKPGGNLDGLKSKLNPTRLQNQMFAYTVTNQGINTFFEIGLPWVMRGVEALQAKFMAKKNGPSDTKTPKKKVSFEDEKPQGGEAEKKWLEHVRGEMHRPAYDLGADYSEMVLQYGYVVIWGAVWPLAGAMALINNILELRSDAYKMSTHHRRYVPTTRVNNIGTWLTSMEILSWLGASVNAALVWMFWGGWETSEDTYKPHISVAMSSPISTRLNLLKNALLAALLASHVYILLRAAVKRIVEKAVLAGVKPAPRGHPVGELTGSTRREEESGMAKTFWEHDEGGEEIARMLKEA